MIRTMETSIHLKQKQNRNPQAKSHSGVPPNEQMPGSGVNSSLCRLKIPEGFPLVFGKRFMLGLSYDLCGVNAVVP